MTEINLEVGQVYHLRQSPDSPIVEREIISIEGERVYYRKSERNEQGHRKIGQCSRRLLIDVINKHLTHR